MKAARFVLMLSSLVACAPPPSAPARSAFVTGSSFLEARRARRPVGAAATQDVDRAAWTLENRPSPLSSEAQVVIGQENYFAWATLLGQIHARLHPLFTDEYLRSLERMPPESPLQNLKLTVLIELHLVPGSGAIHRLGVRRASGVPEFDAAALTAFSRALPVPFPERLASTDGYAYVLWELHRDPRVACSPINAMPIRIATSRARQPE
jgi:hypothetical protein